MEEVECPEVTTTDSTSVWQVCMERHEEVLEAQRPAIYEHMMELSHAGQHVKEGGT